MSTTLPTRSRWALATASSRPVPWAGTLWSPSAPLFLLSAAIPAYAYMPVNRCHQGRTILYDTVSNLSWAVDIRTHGIVNVIEKLLGEPWAPSVEVGREVPVAVPEEDCVVSFALNL